MTYNQLLKTISYLKEGIKYNEIQIHEELLAIVITKNDKVIFSQYFSLDYGSDKYNTINKLREELSKLLILIILKFGIHSGSNINNKPFEEFKEDINKLIEQKYKGIEQ